jgi:uncharacterized protein YlxW (UPF0749 family)
MEAFIGESLLFNRSLKSRDILIALCFLLFGTFLSLQYKTGKTQNNQAADFRSTEFAQLRSRLEAEISKGVELVEENARLADEYDRYIDEYAEEIRDSNLDSKLEMIKRYRVMAGLTDVKGSGLTITMRDAGARENADPSLFIIHDMDILSILNVLRESGAQAISINGERILPISEIMCAGPTVRVNRNRYTVPYIINVIGPAEKLTADIESSLILRLLKEYDISVKIEKKSDIIIKKYHESIGWTINKLTEVME